MPTELFRSFKVEDYHRETNLQSLFEIFRWFSIYEALREVGQVHEVRCSSKRKSSGIGGVKNGM